MGGKKYKIKLKGDQLVMTRKEGRKALHCLIMGFAMFFLSMGLALAIGPGPSPDPEPESIAGGGKAAAAPTPAPFYNKLCSRGTCDTMPGWATFFFSGVVLLLFGLCVGGTVGGCKEEKLAFRKRGERTATLSTVSFKRVESNVKVHRLRDGDVPVALVGQRNGGKGKKMLTAYAVYMYTDAPPLSDGTPQEVRVWSGSKQRAVQMQTMINKFFHGRQRAGTLHPDTSDCAGPGSGLDLEMGTLSVVGMQPAAPRSHGQGDIEKTSTHGLWTISAKEGMVEVDEPTDWQAYLKEARVKSLPGQRLLEGMAKRAPIEDTPVNLEKHDAAVVDIAITTAVDAAGRAMEELIQGGNLGPQENMLWSELLETEELLRVLAEECKVIPEDDEAHRAEARLAVLQLQQLVLRLSGQLQVMAENHAIGLQQVDSVVDPAAAERAKAAVKKLRREKIAALRAKRKRAKNGVAGQNAGTRSGRLSPAARKAALLERRLKDRLLKRRRTSTTPVAGTASASSMAILVGQSSTDMSGGRSPSRKALLFERRRATVKTAKGAGAQAPNVLVPLALEPEETATEATATQEKSGVGDSRVTRKHSTSPAKERRMVLIERRRDAAKLKGAITPAAISPPPLPHLENQSTVDKDNKRKTKSGRLSPAERKAALIERRRAKANARTHA